MKKLSCPLPPAAACLLVLVYTLRLPRPRPPNGTDPVTPSQPIGPTHASAFGLSWPGPINRRPRFESKRIGSAYRTTPLLQAGVPPGGGADLQPRHPPQPQGEPLRSSSAAARPRAPLVSPHCSPGRFGVRFGLRLVPFRRSPTLHCACVRRVSADLAARIISSLVTCRVVCLRRRRPAIRCAVS